MDIVIFNTFSLYSNVGPALGYEPRPKGLDFHNYGRGLQGHNLACSFYLQCVRVLKIFEHLALFGMFGSKEVSFISTGIKKIPILK